MLPANLNVKGIKCDNPSCDFRDGAALFEDYKSWLNKPCPKCGANLLTEKDLDTVRRLREITRIFNWLLKPFVKLSKNTRYVRVPVEMNGTGQVKFKTMEEYGHE